MTKSALFKNNPCHVCGRYDNRPVSIDALIIQKGNIVLIKRGMEPYKGYWALPGGHVDRNETTEDAVIREVFEEIGVKVTRLSLLGVYSDPARHPRQAVAVSYVCQVKGELKAGDDALEVKLFPFDALPSPLAFDHTQIIDDYKKFNQPNSI